jgi:hypothetical protein
MSDEAQERTNTTPKQQGGITGKGFVKGDPRINRKGRPKSFDKLRDLAVSLANETAKDSSGKAVEFEGHTATQIEMLLRVMMRENPARFVEIAFGKVPDITENRGRVEVVVTYEDRHNASEFAPGATDDQSEG